MSQLLLSVKVWGLRLQAAKSAEVDELRRELLAEQSKADAAFEELAVILSPCLFAAAGQATGPNRTEGIGCMYVSEGLECIWSRVYVCLWGFRDVQRRQTEAREQLSERITAVLEENQTLKAQKEDALREVCLCLSVCQLMCSLCFFRV